MSAADIPNLTRLNPSFTADAELGLKKEQSNLQRITWQLTYQPLDAPFDKGHGYDLQQEELEAIRQRLYAGNCLLLVTEDDGCTVGLLEVEPRDWRAVGWIWNILVGSDYRGRGLEQRFIQHAAAWARERGLKALVAETQTSNINACRFYAHTGFVGSGIDDHYYRYCDNPATANDVAIFWYLKA